MRKDISIILLLTGLLAGLVFLSCNISPGFDSTPEISFVSLSKDTMNQGSLLQDSLVLTFAFKDGNGDIGGEGSNMNMDINLIDSRTGDLYDGFNIPTLPASGAKGGIEGNIKLVVYSACCEYESTAIGFPCDTSSVVDFEELTIDITMKDNADNVSNKITTPPITLICN